MSAQTCFRLDLHMHSTFSDANWDYAQIITESIHNDLDLIAITDHDVISNVKLLQEHCANTNISFLTGIEFSSSLDGNLFHILGYGFDWLNKDINGLMKKTFVLKPITTNLEMIHALIH